MILGIVCWFSNEDIINIVSKFHLDTCNTPPPLTFLPGLWNVSLEFKKMTSEHRFENEKSRLNQAITRKIAKNNEKSMKKFKKLEKKNSPYMHPICALYTPYMHPIWRTYLARARARARMRAPGPRRRGASGPYPQKRVKLFPHARAPANGFLFQFGFNHFS